MRFVTSHVSVAKGLRDVKEQQTLTLGEMEGAQQVETARERLSALSGVAAYKRPSS